MRVGRLVEQRRIAQARFDLVGNIKGKCLNGIGGIDASTGDKNAAVHNKQVVAIMGAAKFVDDRALRVRTHARCPHQVPPTISVWAGPLSLAAT